MSESVTPTDQDDGQEISAELVETIDALEEGDLVQVNQGSRIWTVTDVVDQEFKGSALRESQRGVRLESDAREGDPHVRALVADRHPDRVEAAVRVLASDRPGAVGYERPLEHVRRTDGKIPWVVVRCKSKTNVYHRPDPGAAMQGEAEPACRSYPGGTGYRFVRRSAVKSHYDPCKDCFSSRMPVQLTPAVCPRCETLLTDVVLHGRNTQAVEAVRIACHVPKCGYAGEVDLTSRADKA